MTAPDIDTLAATVQWALHTSATSREEHYAALAALVEHARTLERERDEMRRLWEAEVARNHRVVAAEARADRYEKAIRDAAEGEEHLLARAGSHYDADSAMVHRYAASVLRSLLSRAALAGEDA